MSLMLSGTNHKEYKKLMLLLMYLLQFIFNAFIKKFVEKTVFALIKKKKTMNKPPIQTWSSKAKAKNSLNTKSRLSLLLVWDPCFGIEVPNNYFYTIRRETFKKVIKMIIYDIFIFILLIFNEREMKVAYFFYISTLKTIIDHFFI